MRSGLGGFEMLRSLLRGYRQDAGESGDSIAVPQHIQKRLSALPGPGDAAVIFEDY